MKLRFPKSAKEPKFLDVFAGFRTAAAVSFGSKDSGVFMWGLNMAQNIMEGENSPEVVYKPEKIHLDSFGSLNGKAILRDICIGMAHSIFRSELVL